MVEVRKPATGTNRPGTFLTGPVDVMPGQGFRVFHSLTGLGLPVIVAPGHSDLVTFGDREMAARRPITLQRKPSASSAKTNGKPFLGVVDGRSPSARRHVDLESGFARDVLAAGGGELTVTEKLRISQAAALAVRAEQLQAQIARGDLGISDADLVRVANVAARELKAVDAMKTARAKKPTAGPDALRLYLEEKRAREAAGAAT